eukprot:SAG31_NODE_276_length_18650_cov_5.821842_4_plen_211_part_00
MWISCLTYPYGGLLQEARRLHSLVCTLLRPHEVCSGGGVLSAVLAHRRKECHHRYRSMLESTLSSMSSWTWLQSFDSASKDSSSTMRAANLALVVASSSNCDCCAANTVSSRPISKSASSVANWGSKSTLDVSDSNPEEFAVFWALARISAPSPSSPASATLSRLARRSQRFASSLLLVTDAACSFAATSFYRITRPNRFCVTKYIKRPW